MTPFDDECGRCEEKQASCKYCARMTPALLAVTPAECPDAPEVPDEVVKAAVALFHRPQDRSATLQR